MDHFDPYRELLGIPEGPRPVTPAQLLGLSAGERDPGVIGHAADRNMTRLKSQQVGPRAAMVQQLLNEVAAAKTILLNPQRPPEPSPPLSAPPMASPPIEESTVDTSNSDAIDPSDFVPRAQVRAVAAYHRRRSGPATPVAAIVTLSVAVILTAVAIYMLLR